jgi:hypothetical protein
VLADIDIKELWQVEENNFQQVDMIQFGLKVEQLKQELNL